MTETGKPRDFTGKTFIGFIIVGIVAATVRRSRSTLGDPWPWVLFGMILLGGFSTVSAITNGRFKTEPARAMLVVLAALCAGALLGYWIQRPD